MTTQLREQGIGRGFLRPAAVLLVVGVLGWMVLPAAGAARPSGSTVRRSGATTRPSRSSGLRPPRPGVGRPPTPVASQPAGEPGVGEVRHEDGSAAPGAAAVPGDAAAGSDAAAIPPGAAVALPGLTPDVIPQAGGAGVEGESEADAKGEEARLDAEKLQDVTDEELAALEQLVRQDLRDPAKRPKPPAPQPPLPVPTTQPDEDAWERGLDDVPAPSVSPVKRPSPPGGREPGASPGGHAESKPAGIPLNKEGQPDPTQQEGWFKIPPEERLYFFSWKNTTMERMCEDLSYMSGLSMLGLSLVPTPDKQKTVTFQSEALMTYDEALTTFNEILYELNYWVLRRDKYLVIRQLTEWYRHIPAERTYRTLEAYREAKLPSWELVSVLYDPKHASATVLAQEIVDSGPLNVLQTKIVPQTNLIEMSGFVLFIDRQLKLLEMIDVDPPPARSWVAYRLKYASPSDAAQKLETLLPDATMGMVTAAPAAGAAAAATRDRTRAAAATPTAADAGMSEADLVDIEEDARLSRLLIRATPAKHEEIKKYLETFIDLPLEGSEPKLIKLQHADASEVAKIIEPLLGPKKTIHHAAPQVPAGQKPPPAPPPTTIIETQTEILPVPHLNALFVKAAADEMEKIEKFIAELDVPEGPKNYLYQSLEHASAAAVATVLNNALGAGQYRGPRASTGEVFSASANPADDKGLVLRGSPSDIAEAKALVVTLDVDPEEGFVQQMVDLVNVVPTTLSQILMNRFQGGGSMRSYRGGMASGSGYPKFIPDDDSNTMLVVCHKDEWDNIRLLIQEIDEKSTMRSRTVLYRLKNIDGSAITAVLAQALQKLEPVSAWRTRSGGIQVSYEMQSNAFVVTGSDKVQEAAKSLIAELDQPSPTGTAEWRVIQLEKADAEYVAGKLEELFPPQSRGRWSLESSGPPKPDVRVMPEPMTNRVLVSSSEEDFKQAEDFAKKIEAQYAQRDYVREIFTLKHADASAVMQAVQTLFPDDVEVSGGYSRGYYRSGGYGRSYSTETPPLIRLAQTTNGIVVLATKEKMEEIRTLIGELDTSPTADNVVKTYTLKTVDSQGSYKVAQDLQQVFDAKEGKRTSYYSASQSPVKFIGQYGSKLLFVSAPRDRMEEVDELVQKVVEAGPPDMVLTIRHFELKEASPDDIADLIENALEAKFEEMQQSSGGRSYGYRMEPDVRPHPNARKLMVSAPESLMPLATSLIQELDRAPEDSVMRIVQLQTASVEEIVQVVEQQLSRSSSSSSYSRRRRWSSSRSPYESSSFSSGSSEAAGDVRMTAVPSSNSIILRGPDDKVREAEDLIATLDKEARPDGPMIKIYPLKWADMYDVVSMIEEVVGGGSSDDYGFSPKSRGGSDIIVKTDYTGNQIIVSAPFEKHPQVAQIVEMREGMARAQKEHPPEDTGGTGVVIGRGEKSISKLYDVSEETDAEEVTEQLDKVLVALMGYMDAPYVKTFPYANKIVVEGRPEQFKQVEEWLGRILQEPPKPKQTVRIWQLPEGMSVRDVIGPFASYTAGMVSIRPMERAPGEIDPLRMIEEVHLRDVVPTATQPAFFVTPNTVASLGESLSRLTWAQATVVQTQPAAATRPAGAATAPAKAVAASVPAKTVTSAPRTATAPVSAPKAPTRAPAAVASVPKAATSAPAGQASTPVKAPASMPAGPAATAKATTSTPAALASVPKAPASTPAKPEAAGVAKPAASANKAEAPAKPQPVKAAADGAPAAERKSLMDQVYEGGMAALREAQATGLPQLVYDEEARTIMLAGPASRVDRMGDDLDDVIERLKDLVEEEFEPERPVKVFRVNHVDVNVAASILESVFNEKPTAAAQAKQQPKQPAQKQPQAAGKEAKPGEEEGPEATSSRRRREQEEEAQKQAEAAKAQAAAERIRVVPDSRMRTLIIRAAPEDFRPVAELLLKIDQPSDQPPVNIRIFRLEKLNAYEVEQALKSILKIQDRRDLLRTRLPRTGRGGVTSGADAAALIDQLEASMLELEASVTAATTEGVPGQTPGEGEGKLRLNPAKDISITSDATTNTVIVQAPAEGMKLVEKLINDLEAQDVPIQIEAIALQHAEAEKVAGELEKLFQASRQGRGGGPTGGEAITPSRMGDVRITADARTNTLVVRALQHDMAKVKSIVAEMDKQSPAEDMRIYTVQHANATDLAKNLMALFADPSVKSGPTAVLITADEETNSLLVKAAPTKQPLIEAKIQEFERLGQVKTTPRQIALKYAKASTAAQSLTNIFVGDSRAMKQRVTITGDDNARMLFVAAPDELFKEIEKVALELIDVASDQDVHVYKLKNAFATDILDAFKEIMRQTMTQLRGQGGSSDVFAASADARTNSLIVAGNPATFLVVEKVLKDLDVEQPPEATTPVAHIRPLQKADAASVASTINSLYATRRYPGGIQPPRAVAVPTTNVVYIYGTQSQVQEIMSGVVDPLEQTLATTDTTIKQYELPVTHAKVEDAAKTITDWFASRQRALTRAGITAVQPAEHAVEILPDPATKKLFISCTEANKTIVDGLMKTLDVEGVTEAGQQVEHIPVKYANLSYAVSALTEVFRKTGRVPEREQITITPEYGTNSVIIKALPEDMQKIKDLLARIDSGSEAGMAPPKTVRLENARASDVARMITDIIRRTMKVDRNTGSYPVTVVGDDPSNTLLVTATIDKDLERIMGLVKELDVPPPAEKDREIRRYTVRYADMSSVMTAINTRFADRANRPIKDQVAITPDYVNSALIVTASAESHDQVGVIIEQLDQENVEATLIPERIKLEHAKASAVYSLLSEMIRRSFRVDRKTGTYPITVSYDDTANVLLVTANAKNMETAKTLIAQLDVAPPAEEDREIRRYTVRYADMSSVMTAINTRFADRVNRPVKDQVAITLDYVNSALIVTASPESHQEVGVIIEQLDQENVEATLIPERIKLEHAKASAVYTLLSEMIRRSFRVDRKTGTYPITVSYDDTANVLLVTANAKNMETAKTLIAQLDVAPEEDVRDIDSYPLKFADLGSVMTAINARFAQNATRPVKDQVTFTPDYANNILMVTASKENHEIVKTIVDGLDNSEITKLKAPEAVKVEHVLASELAKQLNVMIQQSMKRDRRTGGYPITVAPNDSTNTLLIQADPKDMELVKKLVAELDLPQDAEDDREILPYVIKNADVNAVVGVIKAQFADTAALSKREQVDVTPEPATNSVVVRASQEKHAEIAELLKKLDETTAGVQRTFPVAIEHTDAEEVAATLTEIYRQMPRKRTGQGQPTFTSRPGSKTLLVTCTEAELEDIKQLVAEMDQPEASERDLRVVSIENITPDEMKQALTDYLTKSGGGRGSTLLDDVRITASRSSNVVMLSGPKRRLDELAALVTQVDTAAPSGLDTGREVAIIPLQNADPSSVASMITQAFSRSGSVPESEKIYAAAERGTNSVVVTASKEKLAQITAKIEELDKESANVPHEEIIRLAHARAEEVAEVLTQTYRSSSRSRTGPAITVNADPNLNGVVISAGERDLEGIRKMVKELDQPAGDPQEELRVIPLEFIDAAETLDIMTEYLRKPSATAGRRGSASELIGDIRLQSSETLNALIVSGSKEEIQHVESLVKSMDKENLDAAGAPKLLKIEHASAPELATTLTQMFTDPAKQQTRSRSTRQEMVPLIMADEATNTLIVRARKSDYHLIEDMAKKLDVEREGPTGVKLVQVQRGVDLQSLSSQIESTINTGERYKSQQQTGYRPRQVSIGYDDRASVLFVAGAPELFRTVEELVQTMQKIKPTGAPGVRVVPVKNLDADDMRRLIEEMAEPTSSGGSSSRSRSRTSRR